MKTNKKVLSAKFGIKAVIPFIVLCIMLIPKQEKAQSCTLGITAGASTASVDFSNIGNSFVNTVKGNNIMGFEGGLFERLNLGPFFIKPMELVSYQGGTATYYNSDGSVNKEKFDYGNFEIPLLFGIKILGPLRIEAGPVYSWIYMTHFSEDNGITVDRSDFGWRAGANVELGPINLGLAYQGLANSNNYGSSATYQSPNELIFSLALCFGGK